MKIASVLAASCCAALNICMIKELTILRTSLICPTKLCAWGYTLCLHTTHMLYLPLIFSSSVTVP